MARNLVTWDPFREMSSIREDMERVFDTMVGRYPRERVEGFWAPSVDVEETNDAVTVCAIGSPLCWLARLWPCSWELAATRLLKRSAAN